MPQDDMLSCYFSCVLLDNFSILLGYTFLEAFVVKTNSTYYVRRVGLGLG